MPVEFRELRWVSLRPSTEACAKRQRRPELTNRRLVAIRASSKLVTTEQRASGHFSSLRMSQMPFKYEQARPDNLAAATQSAVQCCSSAKTRCENAASRLLAVSTNSLFKCQHPAPWEMVRAKTPSQRSGCPLETAGVVRYRLRPFHGGGDCRLGGAISLRKEEASRFAGGFFLDSGLRPRKKYLPRVRWDHGNADEFLRTSEQRSKLPAGSLDRDLLRTIRSRYCAAHYVSCLLNAI